jgi:ATP-binding cassette subfamily B protein RaxB
MTAEMTETGALWFPHHFLGDTPCLGREGVFFQQSHGDCGGAALKMILEHFDIPIEYGPLWQRLQDRPEGTTMLGIKQLAESAGLLCEGWRLSPQDLRHIPLPAVLLLQRRHFVVVASVDADKGILILDPVRGRLLVSVRKLVSVWNGETLLFCKRGTASKKGSCWFARQNHFLSR